MVILPRKVDVRLPGKGNDPEGTFDAAVTGGDDPQGGEQAQPRRVRTQLQGQDGKVLSLDPRPCTPKQISRRPPKLHTTAHALRRVQTRPADSNHPQGCRATKIGYVTINTGPNKLVRPHLALYFPEIWADARAVSSRGLQAPINSGLAKLVRPESRRFCLRILGDI